MAQIVIDFVEGFQNDAYCGLFGDVLMDSGFLLQFGNRAHTIKSYVANGNSM